MNDLTFLFIFFIFLPLIVIFMNLDFKTDFKKWITYAVFVVIIYLCISIISNLLSVNIYMSGVPYTITTPYQTSTTLKFMVVNTNPIQLTFNPNYYGYAKLLNSTKNEVCLLYTTSGYSNCENGNFYVNLYNIPSGKNFTQSVEVVLPHNQNFTLNFLVYEHFFLNIPIPKQITLNCIYFYNLTGSEGYSCSVLQ